MAKINFTKEHNDKLQSLAGEALMNGTKFKGNLGSEMNIHDLIHNCTVNTLSRYHSNIKKEVTEIENLDDEWSLTDYQQRKAAELKKTQELINLLIGYKRYQAESEAEKAKLAELKATYKELKESTTSPEVRLKEMEDQIAALGGTV